MQKKNYHKLADCENRTIEPSDTTLKTISDHPFPASTFNTRGRDTVTVPASASAGEVYTIGVTLRDLHHTQSWFQTNNDTPLRPQVKVKPSSECN